MRFSTKLLAAGLFLALGATAGNAQEVYPSRVIKIVVPTTPGAVTDIIARVVAKMLSDSLGQSVIVDNRPGGDELLGGETVAKSAPDGYTLLVGSNGGITSSPQLHKDKRFDPIKDLTPIFMLGQVTPVMAVPSSMPVKTVKEFIDYVKSKPGQLNYGSFGNGSYSHVAMEDFKKRTGTEILHVPYRGAAPAWTAVLRNEAAVMISNFGSARGHVESGAVRIIAAAGPKRSRFLPDLPTIGETLPGFSTGAWWGVFGPANMPQPVVDKIRGALIKAMTTEEMKRVYDTNTLEPIEMTQPQFVKFISDDHSALSPAFLNCSAQ
jgi:tripartite-type tricarboxylate transporter receptor subunit TctC